MGDQRNQTSCSSPIVLASPEIIIFLFGENYNTEAVRFKFFKTFPTDLRATVKLVGRPEDNLVEHMCEIPLTRHCKL